VAVSGISSSGSGFAPGTTKAGGRDDFVAGFGAGLGFAFGFTCGLTFGFALGLDFGLAFGFDLGLALGFAFGLAAGFVVATGTTSRIAVPGKGELFSGTPACG